MTSQTKRVRGAKPNTSIEIRVPRDYTQRDEKHFILGTQAKSGSGCVHVHMFIQPEDFPKLIETMATLDPECIGKAIASIIKR